MQLKKHICIGAYKVPHVEQELLTLRFLVGFVLLDL